MEAYIISAFGILVSVGLFLLGYRQTIGARRERVRTANKAVNRALLRRMVLEEYKPRYKDIARILEGKAREFNVNAVDLHSEEQILNQLFTEVFDNDLITSPQRVAIEQRLDEVFDEIMREKEEIERPIEQIAPISGDQKDKLIAVMGIVASMLGAVTVLIFTITRKGLLLEESAISDIRVLVPVIGVFLGSLLLVAFISIFKRSREVPEGPSRRTAIHEGIELEQEIALQLAKLGWQYQIEPATSAGLRPDFLIEVNGKRIAIEAKAWSMMPPLRALARIRNYAKALLDSKAADEVVIVTKSKSPIPQGLSNVEGIYILPLKELRAFLKTRAE